MSQKDQYFSGAEQLKGIDLQNLDKKKSDYIGSGFFSDVYTLRDKEGNTSSDYVVKFLVKSMYVDRFFMNIRRKLGELKSESSMYLDPNFRAEVAALVDLKGQQIGPNIVYANFTNYYYVVEKMDDTLIELIEKNKLSPSQVLKLVALGDRYLSSQYYHNDMHTANIMWSDKLNDFRIIDWGIYLIIKPDTKPSIILKKENNVFIDHIIWFASLYTKIKRDEGGENLEQWNAIAEKISRYIEGNFPERTERYDIFNSDFKYKWHLKYGIRQIKNIQQEYAKKVSKKSRKKGGKRKKNKTRKL